MPNFCNSDGIGAGRYAGGNQSHGVGAETAAQHPPKAASLPLCARLGKTLPGNKTKLAKTGGLNMETPRGNATVRRGKSPPERQKVCFPLRASAIASAVPYADKTEPPGRSVRKTDNLDGTLYIAGETLPIARSMKTYPNLRRGYCQRSRRARRPSPRLLQTEPAYELTGDGRLGRKVQRGNRAKGGTKSRKRSGFKKRLPAVAP